jgi:hypothetical protein
LAERDLRSEDDGHDSDVSDVAEKCLEKGLHGAVVAGAGARKSAASRRAPSP